MIRDVEVRGVSRVSAKVVAHRVHTKPGDVLDMQTLAGDLRRVYLIGEFEQVSFDLEGEPGNRRLVITAEEKSWGPWYIRPGAGVEANANGLGRFTALAQLRRPYVNRLGGEWRSLLTIGNFFSFRTEFWQPIEYSGHFFVAPRAEFVRRGQEAIRIADQITVVDADARRLGFDFGYQIGPIGEVRVGLVRGDVSLDALQLPAGKQDADLGYQRTLVTIDQLDNVYFPSKGTFAELDLRFSRAGLGADDEYDRLHARFVHAWNSGKNRWLLQLEYGSGLGTTLPLYADFTLGGFFRLSGFDRDALVGQVIGMGKLLYYRQVGSLPSLLGGDFYLGASLETGNAWTNSTSASFSDLLLAGSVWAGVDTILGPIYAGYGHAEGGNGSWYFFLGRIF